MRTDRAYVFLILIAVVGVLSAYYHATDITPRLFGFEPSSDIMAFYAESVEPGMPYIDKLIEYPVITGLFIHLAGAVGGTYAGYYLFNSFFLIAAAIAATYFLYRATSSEDRRALLTYWIFAPSMFFFLIYNWDIIAILFVAIALYFMQRDRVHPAAAFLALGFSSKLYPVLYLLPLLMTRRRMREWARIIVVFGVVALAINGAFMLIDFDGWSYFSSFHSERAPNHDSIWAVANTIVPSLSVAQINILSLALFSSASLIALWRYRHDSVIRLCFIVTLIFLISNKVFSPQYVLWLLPFYVLLPMKNKKLFYALELANLVVYFTIIRYYSNSDDAVLLNTSRVFVVVRHVLLVWMLYYVLRRPSRVIPGQT